MAGGCHDRTAKAFGVQKRSPVFSSVHFNLKFCKRVIFFKIIVIARMLGFGGINELDWPQTEHNLTIIDQSEDKDKLLAYCLPCSTYTKKSVIHNCLDILLIF
jgi:hypothetical protein